MERRDRVVLDLNIVYGDNTRDQSNDNASDASSDYAKPQLTEPGFATYLDRAIVRIAIHDARKLIAEGRPLDEAATLACPGAWAEWRNWVLMWLRDSTIAEQAC